MPKFQNCDKKSRIFCINVSFDCRIYIAAAFRLHQIGWFPTVWGNVTKWQRGRAPVRSWTRVHERTEGLFRLPCKGWFPTVWGNVAERQRGRAPVRSWLWATRTDWGIKKQNTTYLKLIHPHRIPPACLRQPTSLYKGGKKRIKGHAHSF